MMQKVKNWSKEIASDKSLNSCFLLFIFICLFQFIFISIYDTDMYFLIATGREILKNGIPYTNPWTIDAGQGFIAQQWLYCIFIAIADKFNEVGFSIFFIFEFILLLFVSNIFLNIKKIPVKAKILIISVAMFIGNEYLFSLRPEAITLVFLLIECIALEKFRETNNWKHLIWLPITMIAEMNFHASMWTMHYAILLAYIVPPFYINNVKDNSLLKKWKPILVFTIIMTVSMFINPYGLDGIMYIVYSFKENTFSFITIGELIKPSFLSVTGVIIFVEIILLLLNYKYKILDSTTLNISLGLIFLSMLTTRNEMFSFIAIIFLLRNIYSIFHKNQLIENFKTHIKNYHVIMVIMGSIMLFTLLFVSMYKTVINVNDFKNYKNFRGLNNIYEYIMEDYNEDMHIFTGFNTGAFFEWKGFKNLYIEARPEVYTPSITKDRHILSDYSKYVYCGFDIISNDVTSFEEMDNWFKSYDFDYVVIDKNSEQFLLTYIKSNNDYNLVDSCSNEMIVLFERIKEE